MHESGEVNITLDLAAVDAERVLGSTFEPEVIADDVIFGEGPIWDKQSGQLFFVDICGDTIYKWKPGSTHEASTSTTIAARCMWSPFESDQGIQSIYQARQAIGARSSQAG